MKKIKSVTRQIRVPEQMMEEIKTLNANRKEKVDKEESVNKTIRIVLEKGLETAKN